jgi:hypothetical protein
MTSEEWNEIMKDKNRGNCQNCGRFIYHKYPKCGKCQAKEYRNLVDERGFFKEQMESTFINGNALWERDLNKNKDLIV